jgi:uncharacterized pyridoxal phosphate-containing UPF0001 family protein
MTIAPLSEDRAVAQRTFAHLARIARQVFRRILACRLPSFRWPCRATLRKPFREGSTLVRIGTALIGARVYLRKVAGYKNDRRIF